MLIVEQPERIAELILELAGAGAHEGA
jgi:hypothetical protein